MTEALLETNLPLANRRSGKVRDLYDLTLADGAEGLLIVSTDRVSVFDVVLGNGIPGKGVILTKISKFWFDFFAAKHQHHLVSTEVSDIPGLDEKYRASLEGRIMVCRKSHVVPVECIVRGYLTGSGYKDYLATGQVCGIDLPTGLLNSSRIEKPIFTPSTKAEQGHDENISFDESCRIVGADLMRNIRDISLSIFTEGRDYALQRGIIIADTKFEFGIESEGGAPVLIDEVLTPDSSRFWPAEEWQAGQEQNSFDKQIVRNFTEQLVEEGQWNKEYPGPEIPEQIIEKTLNRYQQLSERLLS